MEGLKKTGVAAMIMVVCIVLAVLLGEMRADTYREATETGIVAETQQRSGIGKVLYDWSTYGTIQRKVDENIGPMSNSDSGSGFRGFSVGKLIGVIILVAIITSIFKNR